MTPLNAEGSAGAADSDMVVPFRLDVAEAELRDLRERLARVRWASGPTVSDTSQGPPPAKLAALVDYWQHGYSWRGTEARLNAIGQFTTVIDGLEIYFLHVKSPEPGALPLILTHGWPESILDFEEMIGPLTDPVRYGGDARDAFHLVIPSLPGFGFSGKPSEPGWGPQRTADAWISLMQRLGYGARWAAHGSDVGFLVTQTIATKHPPGLVGVHVPFVVWPASPEEIADATPEERQMLDDAERFFGVRGGYLVLQMNRPQTIGYAIDDSPLALASWIYTMLQDGCGTPGDPEASFTLDQMLDLIMFYWLPKSGASAARMYWEMGRNSHLDPNAPRPLIEVPAGVTIFPGDALRKSRRWVESRFANLVHFANAERGGHYSSLEQPATMVEELRATFVTLR
jgi:microsomal epoxide hydrolase